jgi:hypothetical protein
MTFIRQYNDFACFAACLESFLRDNQRVFDHENFIKNNLDLFNEGKDIQGSCDVANFQEVANRVGIKYEIITKLSGIKFSPPKETILFGVFWDGKESDKHVVRYYKKNLDKLKVMNPLRVDDFDEIKSEWIKAIFKFSI